MRIRTFNYGFPFRFEKMLMEEVKLKVTAKERQVPATR